MGWWEDIEGNMLGDIVADMLTDVTAKIRASHPGVSFEVFLAAATQAVNACANQVEDGAKLPAERVVARLVAPENVFSTIEPSGEPPDDLVDILREGFLGAAHIIEETFERKARVSELLANLNFVIPPGNQLLPLGEETRLLYFQAR